ncbi:ribonuclease HII [archaeon]|nr:ribonuclease HII [archaeon]
MIISGIDEAGKGPVIGSMFIVGCSLDESRLDELKEIGVKDSKLLSIKKIHLIAEKVKKICNYELIEVKVDEIDSVLEGKDSNLNWLEADKTIEIIKKLKPDKAIVDSPSVNLEKYKEYLSEEVDVELEVCHKAEKYEIVAAASIIAKSTREKEIEKLKEKYGDFGSGYTSDWKTQEYLKENYKKNKEIFRKSWSSYKKLVEGSRNKKLGEF